MGGPVVVGRDVVPVNLSAAAFGDEVHAFFGPAALQVPAEVQAAADPRLDHPIAQELHVGAARARAHASPEVLRILGGDASRDVVAVARCTVAASASTP